MLCEQPIFLRESLFLRFHVHPHIHFVAESILPGLTLETDFIFLAEFPDSVRGFGDGLACLCNHFDLLPCGGLEERISLVNVVAAILIGG